MLEGRLKVLNENQGILGLLTVLTLLTTCVFSYCQYDLQLSEYKKTLVVGLTYHQYDPPREWCASFVSDFTITNYGKAWSNYEIRMSGEGLDISRGNETEMKQKIESEYSIGPQETKPLRFFIQDKGIGEKVSYEIHLIDKSLQRTFYDQKFTYERNGGCLQLIKRENLLEGSSGEESITSTKDYLYVSSICLFLLVFLIPIIFVQRSKKKKKEKDENWKKDITELGYR
jgi:hypothetical protein